MIRLMVLLAVLALGPVAARAEAARVISGEHADFTRLVIDLPGAADWTVGRTSMGYAFASGAGAQPTFDLSRVWDRIPRTRLQALRTDPQTGALLLTLACDCHVFPFEYRPGTVVLDIREGAAPAGSAFEAPFRLAAAEVGAPLARTAEPARYDWLDAPAAAVAEPWSRSPLPIAPGRVALDPLRNELLEQISRGAAAGVVDMELPGPPPQVADQPGTGLPWAQIRIGEMPGIAVVDPERVPGSLPGDGEACVPDAAIALSEWGGGRPPLDLLAEARTGIYGEFDALDPAAVLRAVRIHLYLGFGAEAAQYGKLLQTARPTAELTPDQAESLAVYLSMARLVDGESDPGTPFAGMLRCDGAAALWAALAHSRLPGEDRINADAVLRGFLALPPHQRRFLGPDLAGKFLAADNPAAARLIRDAVERTPLALPEDVALIDASAKLHADRPAEARALAEAAIAAGATDFASLAFLVEAHFRDRKPLAREIATAIDAFVAETQGDAAAKQRTLVLALALSGQTDAAFAIAPTADPALSDLWRVTLAVADDDTFLRHAVLPLAGPVPPASAEVPSGVAGRLLALGFADAALAWLGPVALSDPDDKRRLAAEAQLARRDARSALALLEGLAAPEDQALRARAQKQLGDFAQAQRAYAAAGMTAEAERLVPWTGNFAEVTAIGSAPWSEAAQVTLPTAADAGGPLARGSALVEKSAAARAAIEALLASVEGPDL